MKKEFIHRLSYRLFTSANEEDDMYIYVSSYDGIFKASSATFEVARMKKDGKPYKISMTYDEFFWLINSADFGSDEESISFPGRNNLTITSHESKNNWNYFKIKTRSRYEKFIFIGQDQVNQLKQVGGDLCILVSRISTVKRDYVKNSKADFYPLHVATSFFSCFIEQVLNVDGNLQADENPSIKEILSQNGNWNSYFAIIAPLFGIGTALEPDTVCKAIKRGVKMWIEGGSDSIDKRISDAMENFMENINIM